MKNEEYTKLVDQGKFPDEIKVPLDNVFKNHNGTIDNLILSPMNSVALIKSYRGTVRANHYHKTDWHYAYVIKGRILYFERAIGSTDIPKYVPFGPGEMFFTRPMVEHAMVFPEATEFLTFAKNIRSHDNHEDDLTRVEFITPEVLEKYVSS